MNVFRKNKVFKHTQRDEKACGVSRAKQRWIQAMKAITLQKCIAMDTRVPTVEGRIKIILCI